MEITEVGIEILNNPIQSPNAKFPIEVIELGNLIFNRPGLPSFVLLL